MKKALAISLFIICMLFCTSLYSVRAVQSVDRPLEPINIKLHGLDGKLYDIAEMRGSVLLVSFGATWCSPCWTELRALEELRTEYQSKPVRFLWVSIDRREHLSDGALRDFVKEHRLTFPVLRDPTQLTYAQFSTRTRLPYVIFFDKEGNITTKHVGMTQPEVYKKIIRDRLDTLLREKMETSSSSDR